MRPPAHEKYKELHSEGFGSRTLTLNECISLILAISDNKLAIILIDALDECNPERRYELLEALDTILQECANLVKIFVSSRDDGDIV